MRRAALSLACAAAAVVLIAVADRVLAARWLPEEPILFPPHSELRMTS